MKLKIKLFSIIILIFTISNCGNIINDYLNGPQGEGSRDQLPVPGTPGKPYNVFGTVKYSDIDLDGVKIILSDDDMNQSINLKTYYIYNIFDLADLIGYRVFKRQP